MIILRIACDNLYMFKNFDLDFTYNRSIEHYLAYNDTLFSGSHIKVRKNFIVMGANSTGKTTFGKLLCLIVNYVCGRNLDESIFRLNDMRYNKDKDAYFEVEFVLDKTAYLLKAVFNKYGLKHEELSQKKIYKSYNISILRQRLYNSTPISVYDANVEKVNVGFSSFAFFANRVSEVRKLSDKIGYIFRFSEFASNSVNYRQNIDIDFIAKLLPKIDTSVKQVTRVYSETGTPDSNSYKIVFKNGETLLIANGDLLGCPKRLSHGTFEAINFITILNAIRSKGKRIIYIDEQLAHLHPELEAYFAYKSFIMKSPDMQVFFTTHNTELFELNLPMNSFIFFRRNEHGENEAIFPSDVLNKNDRSLRSYYENDRFGTLPDYTVMDQFFEEYVDE